MKMSTRLLENFLEKQNTHRQSNNHAGIESLMHKFVALSRHQKAKKKTIDQLCRTCTYRAEVIGIKRPREIKEANGWTERELYN